MIYQLMYFSLAEDGLTEQDVDNIVATAIHRNPLHDVTGFLTFNGSEFLQFIEGPEAAVKQLLTNIEFDKRHHSVVTLETSLASERTFPNWTMRRLPQAPKRGEHSKLDTVPEDVRGAVSNLVNSFKYAYVNYLKG